MAHKKSRGTPKSAPDLNDSPNSNARRNGEQMSLDGIPRKPFNVQRPCFGTVDAYVLDTMIGGTHFVELDHMPVEYGRLGAAIGRLRNDMGWKGYIITHPFKHERKTCLVASYHVTNDTIMMYKSILPEGWKPTRFEDLADVKLRTKHRTDAAGDDAAPTVNQTANPTIHPKINSTDGDDDPKLTADIEWLRNVLAGNGYVAANIVEGKAAETRIGPKALKKAGEALKVEVVGKGASAFYKLPDGDEANEVTA